MVHSRRRSMRKGTEHRTSQRSPLRATSACSCSRRCFFCFLIRSSHIHTYAEAMHVEAVRLDVLKLKNIRRFVEAVRAELAALWDKCFYGEEQQRAFVAFYDVADDDCFTEELLERHEAEALRRYEVHRELFEGVCRWRENWTLFRELGGKTADPSRLHNRGGNLLREQKQRADLQKSLPKLEKSLKACIDLWEGGQPFLAYMPGQWAVLQPARTSGLYHNVCDFDQCVDKGFYIQTQQCSHFPLDCLISYQHLRSVS